jgi:hypothetical protein
MSLSTKESAGVSRKEKTERLFMEHEHTFNTLDITNPLFIPKCAYIPYSGSEHVLGFFPSELKKGVDIYTEFVSIELEPEDPKRTLYKWRYNPHYATEYETTEPNSKGDIRYLIPVSELIKIEVKMEEALPKDSFPDFEKMVEQIIDPNTDAPLGSMTMKDFAAIMWKKPVSGKKWLNDLIKQK